MPRKSTVSKELLDAKGTCSQREAAKKFGVSVATVSRAWSKPQPIELDSQMNKFDVEFNDTSKAETIHVEVENGDFLEEMDQMLDKFHAESLMTEADKQARERQSQMAEAATMVDAGVVGQVAIASDEIDEEYVSSLPVLQGIEITDDGEVKETKQVKRKRKDDADDNPLLKEAELALLKMEKQDAKSRAPFQEPTPQKAKKQKLIPQVKLPEPQTPYNQSILLARITSYVHKHGHMLMSYIGDDEASKRTFLKNLGKKKLKELHDIYVGMRSLVNFEQQTQTCRNGIILATSAVESFGVVFGAMVQGMTRDVAADPQLAEICEDFVMVYHEWFTVVDRPEARLFSLMAQTGAQRHAANSAEYHRRKMEEVANMEVDAVSEVGESPDIQSL